MYAMTDEQFENLKKCKKEIGEKSWGLCIGSPALVGDPKEVFLTMCAFYKRDLGLTSEQAHAHMVKEHPDCYEKFLAANTINRLHR